MNYGISSERCAVSFGARVIYSPNTSLQNNTTRSSMSDEDYNDSYQENVNPMELDDGSDYAPDSPKAKAKPKKAPAKKAAPKKASASKRQPLSAANTSDELAQESSREQSFEEGALPSTQSAASKKSASQQYQKLTQLEHILKRPDTYIGSVEAEEQQMWVYESESMVKRKVKIVPGLYKIFDEILVNAADNKIRDPEGMTTLRVDIDRENNKISIYNNGKGIPIEEHEKEKMYIPQMIFGNLLTSSNYDDDEKKVVGGRNGYGAKLCNIFSNKFELETYDKSSGKLYKQTWTHNMSNVSKPIIKDSKGKDGYTKITFEPDLSKFHMTELDDDICSVMTRRVYDLAGTVRGVNVYLNKEKIKMNSFKSYVQMYVKALSKESGGAEATDIKPVHIAYESVNKRWEIAFAPSDGNGFNQVSFVNSIATTSGGTHVSYVSDQLVNFFAERVADKVKKSKAAAVKNTQIKNNMFVFVNCLIENPAFTSQTKEQLTTRVSQFGSKCVPSDPFFKSCERTGILDSIMDIAQANADKELKKQDGGKKRRITGLVKLEDANKAGTREGHKCTLILTEGDSAMTLAVAGLAVVGRDYYGVFPLRGKLLNVREASHDQITKNQEIQNIKQIMGLQHKKVYSDVKDLRYGKIMIMTDQDHDGSHIKGLIINFIESAFPGLLSVPGFLIEFITPIIKVSVLRGKKVVKVIPFYTMPQYEHWRDTEGKTCVWKQKYYKGLGTSGTTEAREYFSQLDKHMKEFETLKEEDKSLIDLAFAKKNADMRKDWLRQYRPGDHLDPELKIIPISDFINKELILFSIADCARSIPSVLDGFKPGQRKVLFGCFKRNLVEEMKVAQLSGYIADKSSYHHGEQSLQQTIVGMAQDFVGSNNLNFLMPNGSFGSRAMGGKDASAPRYIFTQLNPLTRKVFKIQDDNLLNYLEEDEDTVEPEWYLPVIPTILVNGAEGIGTGWSTNIPCYNPRDLVSNIRRLLNNEETVPMLPWFKGWNGELEQVDSNKFKCSGIATQVDESTIEITELPIHMWTQSMKETLLNSIKDRSNEKGWIEDVTEEHGAGIKFVVKLNQTEMAKTMSMGLLQRFKLQNSISTANMVAFDSSGRIKRYENVDQILREYYFVRLEYYQKRKDYLSGQLKNQLVKLTSQGRFIHLIITGELVVSNRKKADIVADLKKLDFPAFGKDGVPVYKSEGLDTEEDVEVDEDVAKLSVETSSVKVPEKANYDYLLTMSIMSLTKERYEKLMKERDAKEVELTELLKLSAKDLWNIDLDEFVAAWDTFLEESLEQMNHLIPGSDPNKKKGKKTTKRKVKSEEDEDFVPGGNKKKTKAAATGGVGKAKSKNATRTPSPDDDKGKIKVEQPPLDSPFGHGLSEVFRSPEKGTAFKDSNFFSLDVPTSANLSNVSFGPSPSLFDNVDPEGVASPEKDNGPKFIPSTNGSSLFGKVDLVPPSREVESQSSPANKSKPRAKRAPVKKKAAGSDDEAIFLDNPKDVSDEENNSVAPRARPARSARATTSYNIDPDSSIMLTASSDAGFEEGEESDFEADDDDED